MNVEKEEQLMELSKKSNAKLEEANEEELRQNTAIGRSNYLLCFKTYPNLTANFFNLDVSIINSMTTDELEAKVKHEQLYDETDMAQIEGVIRSRIRDSSDCWPVNVGVNTLDWN